MSELKSCPRCSNSSAELISVDPGMRLILQKTGIESLPDTVCPSCFSEMTNQVSQGVKLRLEQQAREKNRHMLWKSRVNLVKQARQMMANKSYAEAALSYEKYIRVLEMAYDLKSGQLNPEVFGKSQRSKELTVIATTYWDLLRIYDTSPQYRERMANTARKLAEFIPFSTIYPDVIKKSQAFMNSAKNPDIVKEFLRLSKASTGKCFIATSAFGSENHMAVRRLRHFRNEWLMPRPAGRTFVKIYYQTSPPIAAFLDRNPRLKPVVRKGLALLIDFLPGENASPPKEISNE